MADEEGKKPGFISKVGKVVDWINPLDNLGAKLSESGQRNQDDDKPVRGALKRIGGGILNVAGGAVNGITTGPQGAIIGASSEVVDEVNGAARDPRGKFRSLEKQGFDRGKLETEFKEFSEESEITPRGGGRLKAAGKGLVNGLLGSDVIGRNDAKHFKEMKENGGSMDEFRDLEKAADKGGHDGYVNLDHYTEFKEASAKRRDGKEKAKEHVESFKGALKDGAYGEEYVERFKKGTEGQYREELRENIREEAKEKKGGKKVSDAGPDAAQPAADGQAPGPATAPGVPREQAVASAQPGAAPSNPSAPNPTLSPESERSLAALREGMDKKGVGMKQDGTAPGAPEGDLNKGMATKRDTSRGQSATV